MLMSCFGDIKQDLLFAILLAGVVFIISVLYKVNKAANEAHLVDIILGEDRKASWSKMAAIGGFMIVGFILIWCTVVQHVPEGMPWMILIFLAACVGSPIAFAIINFLRGGPAIPATPPNQEIQASVPAGSSVQINAPAVPVIPQPGATG